MNRGPEQTTAYNRDEESSEKPPPAKDLLELPTDEIKPKDREEQMKEILRVVKESVADERPEPVPVQPLDAQVGGSREIGVDGRLIPKQTQQNVLDDKPGYERADKPDEDRCPLRLIGGAHVATIGTHLERK